MDEIVLLIVTLAASPWTARGQVTSLYTPVTTDSCGTRKACFLNPPGCAGSGCTSVATWNVSTPGYVDFELMASGTPGWVALGLSYDQFMGNDSVVDCVINSTANPTASFIVDVSFNNPQWYNEPLSYTPKSTTIINRSAAVINGTLHCRFQRIIAADGPQVFTLNYPYYLLLAYGPSINGVIQGHSFTPFPSISSSQINPSAATTATTTLPGASTTTLPGASTTTLPGASTTTLPGASTTAIASNSGNVFSDNAGNQMTYGVTSNGLNVQIVISGPVSSTKGGWISVAFSTDTIMQDDSVIDCIRAQNGSLIIQSSYNSFQYNTVVSPPSAGILSPNATYVNGNIQCSLLRPITGVNNADVFNLNTPYYLFLAHGLVDGNGIKQYHGYPNRVISPSMVNLLATSNGPMSAQAFTRCDTCLKRAHGCLMISAWVLIVSTSIIIARYFKTAWPGKKICNVDVWFAIHRFMMLLALALTVSGFIIIFVVNAGSLSNYPAESPSYFWVHAPLGITVMILVVANPVMAAFRCHPNTRFRPIFNWLHWLVGTCVHLLAILTVFFGVKIGELNLADQISHPAIFWILIAFVAFHILIEILLSVDKFTNDAGAKRVFKVHMEMKTKTEPVMKPAEPVVNKSSLTFRYSILALYFTVVFGLWLAMIVLIGTGTV